MGLVNLNNNTSFWSFPDNPFAPTTIAYPGIEISGSKGGWSGFHFKEFNRQFLVRADMQGVFSYQESPGWHWRFNNGKLDVGIVPWARLTDVPPASENQAGLVSREAYGMWTPTVRGATTAGTATYFNRLGFWRRIGYQLTAAFQVSLTAFSGASGDLIISGLPYDPPDPEIANSVAIGKYGGINLQTGFTQLAATVGSISNFGQCIKFWRCGSGQNPASLTVAQITPSSFLVEGTVTYDVAGP